MKKPIIAIDGFSSTGKSSISKIIAEKLDIVHLDTGALYRAITLFAIENFMSEKGVDIENLILNLGKIHLEFKNENGEMRLYMNGENVSQKIRSPKVSEYVSQIARQKEVRDFLLKIQRKMAENRGIIMDGRDIGTVILPNADYKFFLTASVNERAKRRFLELSEMGIETDLKTVTENLIARDKTDSEREISPLKQAEDAILIDNTNLDKQQTIDLILSKIEKF
ncbi:MAG: (d)CMP kinase [Flavobacteriaceae bacterium]|jgi:cytidylate kinase|nr:(d)CMP kinase [Flavobacteriaceae bacterium]